MSNEKHETVMDVIAEMRSNGFDDPRFDKYALWAARRLAKDWADRIEAAAKRADDLWRAAFAKVMSVVSRQHAKRNLGEQGSRAVAEIMSVCRFPDGAIDEYERAVAENARLRAALKPVLDIVMDSATSDLSMEMAINEAKRIYNGSGESEVK